MSTPIIKAWADLPVGVPVHTLDDLAAMDGWLDRALIRPVGRQMGLWLVLSEPGYSVFQIYPYLREEDRPRSFQGVLIKVTGDVTASELVPAIRQRSSTILVDEYELFGDAALGERIVIYNHARPNSWLPGNGRIELHFPRTLTPNLNPDVTSVVSGGSWRQGGKRGFYRVVVIDPGLDHLETQVIAQLVLRPESDTELSKVHSQRSLAGPFSYHLDPPGIESNRDGVRVSLSGALTQDPATRVSCVFQLTADGEIEEIQPCR